MKLNLSLKSLFIMMYIAFASVGVKAGGGAHEEKFNAKEMIMHHVMDAHEWHIMGPAHGEGSVSIYLPILLIDGGFKAFSSSNFYHGEEKTYTDPTTGKSVHYMVSLDKGYGLFHEKIYKLNEFGELDFDTALHPINAKPLDLSITKNVLSLIFGALLIFIIMFAVAKFYKTRGHAESPKGIAKFLEPIILMVRDNIAKSNIDEHKYEKYVPYLLTIFFFIWFNNMLGLIPIIPGGANLTGNISVTFFLALCTLLVTVFSGNKNYWKHIFATPGVPVPLLIIMVPIELVGVLTKPFALMIRLFANITAGHIIILSLIAIIFVNKSAAWGGLSVPMALFISVLELLVAFLQAYLFAMLSALFIGAAVEEAHH